MSPKAFHPMKLGTILEEDEEEYTYQKLEHVSTTLIPGQSDSSDESSTVTYLSNFEDSSILSPRVKRGFELFYELVFLPLIALISLTVSIGAPVYFLSHNGETLNLPPFAFLFLLWKLVLCVLEVSSSIAFIIVVTDTRQYEGRKVLITCLSIEAVVIFCCLLSLFAAALSYTLLWLSGADID